MRLTFEDYVRGVFYLQQANGFAKSKDLAQRLDVSKNTVSKMVQTLGKKGFIQHRRYGHINLTEKGRRLAKKLTYRHRLIERFLTDVLQVPAHKVHYEADRLEHGFSEHSIAAIEKLLNHPQWDPHGQPLNA